MYALTWIAGCVPRVLFPTADFICVAVVTAFYSVDNAHRNYMSMYALVWYNTEELFIVPDKRYA